MAVAPVGVRWLTISGDATVVTILADDVRRGSIRFKLRRISSDGPVVAGDPGR